MRSDEIRNPELSETPTILRLSTSIGRSREEGNIAESVETPSNEPMSANTPFTDQLDDFITLTSLPLKVALPTESPIEFAMVPKKRTSAHMLRESDTSPIVPMIKAARTKRLCVDFIKPKLCSPVFSPAQQSSPVLFQHDNFWTREVS